MVIECSRPAAMRAVYVTSGTSEGRSGHGTALFAANLDCAEAPLPLYPSDVLEQRGPLRLLHRLVGGDLHQTDVV